jgi:hypothetical protein
MNQAAIQSAIRIFLREMSPRLAEAAGIATTADACAESGNADKGVEVVALDIEQLVYEASRLFDAASLLKRLAQS